MRHILINQISLLTNLHPSPGCDTVICIDCDAKKRPVLISRSPHDDKHPILRYCYAVANKELEVKGIEDNLLLLENTINERLIRLENRFVSLDVASENRFERLEKKLTDQEAALNARLDAMEGLLRAMVADKVGQR